MIYRLTLQSKSVKPLYSIFYTPQACLTPQFYSMQLINVDHVIFQHSTCKHTQTYSSLFVYPSGTSDTEYMDTEYYLPYTHLDYIKCIRSCIVYALKKHYNNINHIFDYSTGPSYHMNMTYNGWQVPGLNPDIYPTNPELNTQAIQARSSLNTHRYCPVPIYDQTNAEYLQLLNFNKIEPNTIPLECTRASMMAKFYILYILSPSLFCQLLNSHWIDEQISRTKQSSIFTHLCYPQNIQIDDIIKQITRIVSPGPQDILKLMNGTYSGTWPKHIMERLDEYIINLDTMCRTEFVINQISKILPLQDDCSKTNVQYVNIGDNVVIPGHPKLTGKNTLHNAWCVDIINGIHYFAVFIGRAKMLEHGRCIFTLQEIQKQLYNEYYLSIQQQTPVNQQYPKVVLYKTEININQLQEMEQTYRSNTCFSTEPTTKKQINEKLIQLVKTRVKKEFVSNPTTKILFDLCTGLHK